MFMRRRIRRRIDIKPLYCYSKTGERHREENRENQDCVYSAENDFAAFFAVADGVSACKNSRSGAQLACEVCADILLEHTGYYFDSDEEKVKQILLDNIRSAISRKAGQERCEPEDYASTLSFLCFDKLHERVMTFSLGDSRIYRMNGNGIDRINQTVSHGMNAVCSTTSRRAEKEAVLFRDSKRADDSFLLCTDGFWKAAEADSFPAEPGLFENGGALAALLDRQTIRDDCSFLLAT